MTDGSSACPFVAFEDDRDERADLPDHRHRCFAEAVPAPRALAHQEAYCLSSAFPVCPTFQEWARREAAHAQPGRTRAAHDAPADAAAAGGAGAARAAGAGAADEPDEEPDDLWSSARDIPVEDRPRRNPPRDWAAPPPWAAGPAGASGGAAAGAAGASSRGQRAADPDMPEEGRGLAGSAADRLARGVDPDHAWLDNSAPARPAQQDAPASPAAPADPELAGLVGRRAPARPSDREADDEYEAAPRPTRRPAVSSTRDRARERERDRERERAAEDRGHDGPAWERRRRYEAYPSIKMRAGLGRMPQLPRITVLFGALLVAALLLFLLPTVLNLGGKVGTQDGPISSPSAAAPSESIEPTPTPVPTPVVYTIKSGDTLTKIARRNGLTLEQLLEANKDTIKDPNRIKVGDKIVIPTPPPEEVPAESTEPSASP